MKNIITVCMAVLIICTAVFAGCSPEGNVSESASPNTKEFDLIPSQSPMPTNYGAPTTGAPKATENASSGVSPKATDNMASEIVEEAKGMVEGNGK